MIEVIISNKSPMSRTTVSVDEQTIVRDAFMKASINCYEGKAFLNGGELDHDALNTTFLELGFDGTEGKNKCYLFFDGVSHLKAVATVTFTMQQIEKLKELILEHGTMDAVSYIDKIVELQR